MKLVNAKVIGQARQVKTQYGDRIVFDALISGRDEVSIWRPARDTHLLSLTNNTPVTLAVDSKGKYSLVETDNPGEIVKAEELDLRDSYT